MTYSGGFLPQSPYPVPMRPPLTMAQWLHIATFALGVITLFLGFAPWISSEIGGVEVSAYEGGGGMVPVLSFVAGAVALLAVLPSGTGRPGPLVPALTLGITLNFLFSLLAKPDGVELAAGGVMALLFSVFMTIAAAFAYYLDVRRPRVYPPSFPAPPTGPIPPYR